jgi:hypothetical protein
LILVLFKLKIAKMEAGKETPKIRFRAIQKAEEKLSAPRLQEEASPIVVKEPTAGKKASTSIFHQQGFSQLRQKAEEAGIRTKHRAKPAPGSPAEAQEKARQTSL